jgi:Mg-chelatase subunit ChlD
MWRRAQYLTGLLIFCTLVGGSIYLSYLYEPPSCFDGNQNGDEGDIDCGGSCTRVCSIDILPPIKSWAESFKVVDGQYNAVAYIENRNLSVGTPELAYTFMLYDDGGLITERSGSTVFPPDSVYPIFEGRIDTGDRIPTRTTIELSDEAIWLPAEAGPTQFTIENRVLSGADSKPRLDARIQNTAITEARDVEVVATIFDVRRNPLTASRTVVPFFRGRTTEDVVFTWPEPISKTVRSCEVPTDVVLAIDLSGSMNDDGGNPPEPITSVLEAAEAFVGRLKNDDQIGVVTYATAARLREGLTGDTVRVGNIVRSLTIAAADEVGSTNTGDAIILGNEEINSGRHNQDARKVFVLLTDGLANAPGDEPETYAIEAADALKETDVEVYAIGLGDRVNETFLRQIASDNEHYFQAASASTVDSIYQSITAAICEDGAAVIEIIPKTTTSFPTLR